MVEQTLSLIKYNYKQKTCIHTHNIRFGFLYKKTTFFNSNSYCNINVKHRGMRCVARVRVRALSFSIPDIDIPLSPPKRTHTNRCMYYLFNENNLIIYSKL